MSIKGIYYCPVCGYDKLLSIPYSDIHKYPSNIYELEPPYYILGKPSYEVCSCCGYEYGNDDNPGMGSTGISFDNYYKEWENNGNTWFNIKEKPEDWKLLNQLLNKNIYCKKG